MGANKSHSRHVAPNHPVQARGNARDGEACPIQNLRHALCLEAMKMETLLRAERDATVKQVLVKPGHTVAAKDLLVVLEWKIRHSGSCSKTLS
jgi:pyruvate carboxylase